MATKRKSTSRTRRPPTGRASHLPGLNDLPYSQEELEFIQAMDKYKRDNRRPFPTWHEVLLVVQSLGYKKISKPTKKRVSPAA